MSLAEQHDAISLTVLRQDGNLAASLTDTRLIAKLAHCALPESLLRDLQRDVRELLACCEDSGLGKVPRTVASARVGTLGKRMFDTLLPEPVGSFLRYSSARRVSLQLDADLAWAPWELAFDGENFFGEKFAVGVSATGSRRHARRSHSRGAVRAAPAFRGRRCRPTPGGIVRRWRPCHLRQGYEFAR